MKESLRLLTSYEDELLPIVSRALAALFRQVLNEFSSSKKGELERDAHFLNLFFIVFQLPYLSDPVFIFETATSFYSLLTKLSVDVQAKFVRVLAQHREDLSAHVAHVQQYITMHTVRWCDHTDVANANETLLSSERGTTVDDAAFDRARSRLSLGMHEGLDVLRLLFYGNLLGGERDTMDIIETERDNDQKMEVELTHRRQRREDGDDGEQEQLSQVEQQPDESRSQASASSPVRPRPTSLSMRTSTTEQDEMESLYENPLQIKLDIEPNEYRHGYLAFSDFINEYANEKIEINKEYLDFVRQRPGSVHFSFILYPFFLSTINKIGNHVTPYSSTLTFIRSSLALLNIENKVQMYRQRHSSFVHSIFSGIRLDPFFKICVRRGHLIEDALIAVCYHA